MMKRIGSILTAVLFLLNISTARAEDMNTVSTTEWSAAASNGTVHVTFADGREAVTLNYEPEEFTDELLIAADYNFDGREDLAALTVKGNVNSYFTVWLNTGNGFEHCPTLDGVASPMPNRAAARVESFEHSSAWEYAEASYIWQENEIELFVRREVTYQGDGTIEIVEYMPKPDGMLMRQRRFSEEKWSDVQNAVRRCEEMAITLEGEGDPQRICSYEGEELLQGESYYVCTVRKNYEVLYVMYVSKSDPSVLLIDRETDGMKIPQNPDAEDGR